MKMILVSQITGEVDGVETVTPTAINVDFARTIYPRKNDKPGCRVTFDDGGGWAVTETFDELKTKISAAGVTMLQMNMVAEAQVEIDDDGEEVSRPEAAVPALVQGGFVRCFYPRHQGKPGTRLTFAKGSGMAVAELFETVTTMVA
jgi:hypothetical protein